jgi:hypothetical protein
MKKIILLVLLLNSIVMLYGQKTTTLNPNSIVFKDTLFTIVTDSLSHNLGDIPPFNNKLVKYFKYIGSESVYITRAWTGDPHFICEYPTSPLIKGEIYSFTVCFSNQGRVGHFNKVMGFNLSSGERISFTFKGNVVPVKLK